LAIKIIAAPGNRADVFAKPQDIGSAELSTDPIRRA
jgi:hypothetical protein